MFQFPKKEPFIFTWHIAEKDTGVPVDDCNPVVATLFAGRSADNPDLIPGSPIASFSGVVLDNIGGGDYAGEVGGDGGFNPLPSSNYRVVIDARRDGSAVGHWEEDASVVVNS